jgi:type IV pilus assembly protein PilA
MVKFPVQILLLLRRLDFSNSDQGFTLLELMIVVMITSILLAIGLPNFMSQIGRARESEAKIALSNIGMAQQAYFFEKQTFADQMSKLEVQVTNGYYHYPDPTLTSSIVVKHDAEPQDAANKNIRHYQLGVYFNGGSSYSIVLCQSDNPTLVAIAPDTPTDACVAGTKLD